MDVLINFIDYFAMYAMTKCAKTMVCGTVMMGMIFLVRLLNRRKNAYLNFYAMLLLFPMAFTGMGRFFYLRHTVKFSNLLFRICTPVVSEAYFAVAGILLFCYLHRNRTLRKQVGKLPLFQNEILINGAREQVYRHRAGLGYGNTKVYVTKAKVSPFSGGIFRPFIVLPSRMVRELDEKQLQAVFCHEMIHIRSGHLVWMGAFGLLRIYWWCNPAIWVCERLWRQDMELVCDECSTYYSGISEKQYGKLLLNTVQNMENRVYAGGLSFFVNRDYRILKKRILHLSRKVKPEHFLRQKRWAMAGICALMTLGCVLVGMSSYPRYTEMKEIVLYTEDLKMVDYDSIGLRQAVRIENGEVVLDEGLFERLLQEKQVRGDYVYVSFGGVMKVPGVGGGGNTAMIATADYGDVFYLKADSIENEIMEFLMKYVM